MSSIDRPIPEIVKSIMKLTNNPKMSEQLRRDLEKLCAVATIHDKPVDPVLQMKDLPTSAEVSNRKPFNYDNV